MLKKKNFLKKEKGVGSFIEEYLNLVRKTLTNGSFKTNRTGISVLSEFNQGYNINLKNGFPLMTTKDLGKFKWRSIVAELIWFINGGDNVNELQNYTKIWNAWADEKGNLGPVYGVQWRGFNGVSYATGEVVKIDQLKNLITKLKKNPDDRRIIVTAWNPAQLKNMGLPPCHHTWQAHVSESDGKKYLNIHLTQRSGDIALGIPFNIASYSLLINLIAKEVGFEVGTFGHTIVDAHIYSGKGKRSEFVKNNLKTFQQKLKQEGSQKTLEWYELNAPKEEENEIGYDHIPGLLKQLTRKPRNFPKITLPNKSLFDLKLNDWTSFKLSDYNPHSKISFKIAV